MGARGYGRRRRTRRTHPAVRRLLGVPLVPRHGPRVVRGPGHRSNHERGLREREGGSGGTARRGLHLHGCRDRPDRAGWLAHDRVLPSRWSTLPRRHLLAGHPPGRHAVISTDPGRRVGGLDDPTRRPRRAGRPTDGLHGPPRRPLPRRRPAPAGHAGQGGGPTGRTARRRVGWVRQRAQVPPGHEPRGPPATPGLRGRRRPLPDQGRRGPHHHARRHGLRRHVRPPGRWLRPLLGGPLLAGPPLREDALRQRTPGPDLPPWVAGTRTRPVAPGRHGDDRVRAEGPPPPRWRVLLGGGRRLRGGGGHLLRVVPRGTPLGVR